MSVIRHLVFYLAALIMTGCGETDTKSKAEAGDPNAQYKLGVMYFEGKGVPQDYAEAAKWFKKAGEQGEATAQCNLGIMNYKGVGMPQNHTEAMYWLQKSAYLGLAKSQAMLGVMYDEEGELKNEVEAYAWYNLAALSNGDAKKLRDDLGTRISPETKARAQKRSTELHNEIEAKKASK
jgi:TPR repeat protein